MSNASKMRVLLLFLLPIIALSQVYVNSDSIGVYLKNYGEIEIWGPMAPGDPVKQVDRMTLLVGTDETAVFDYSEDADVDEASVLIADPTLSDMEGYTSINNFYSFAPPDIFATISPYAWNDAEYVIVHMVVTNTADTAIDARIGLEIIPQIDGDYDGINTWIPDGNFLDMTRGSGNHIGFKFLSHSMASLSQFVWFSGYNDSDADLYNWMNTNQIDTVMICTNPDDGIVSIPATAPVTLEPNVGIDFYYGVARGLTLSALTTNMADLQTAYNTIFTVGVDDIALQPGTFSLSQNYPNPFNPSTEISFSIPADGVATLDMFNLRGELVATLHNGWMAAGSYSRSVNGSNLPSGIYVYSLTANGVQLTKKMTLLK